MTPHPAETLLRGLYAAILEHDLATLQLLVAPHVVCHLPGRAELRGLGGAFALWLELTQRSANRPRLTLTEVLVGSCHAAALVEVALEGESAFRGRLFCLVRLEGGRVVECWLHADGSSAVAEA